MTTLDPSHLSPSQLLALVNSTPLGVVLSASVLRRHRQEGGFAFGDGQSVNLARYCGWLIAKRLSPSLPAGRAGVGATEQPPPIGTTAYDEYLARQAAHMSEVRGSARDITIPPVADPARRARCMKSPERFARTYFERIFFHPFSETEREIVAAFRSRLELGGLQAFAAPRGEGKSSLCELLCLWAICAGHRRFVVFFRANARDAHQSLDNVRNLFEDEAFNDFHCDFPELCVPILALQGSAQRGRTQTVRGHRTLIDWSGETLRFARVPDAPISGAIWAVRSIDSGFRGLRFRELRPDLVTIDDIQTRESVTSVTETERTRKLIDHDIAGLSGQNRTLSVFLVCTILRREDLADEYTDRMKRPSWNGKRSKLVATWPEHADLWAQYIELRQKDQLDGDQTGRSAAAFYRAHRPDMDAAAVVSNLHRYDSTKCPDGTLLELSTIQHVHNLIADFGKTYVMTEVQNEPPESEGPESERIAIPAIQRKLSGLPQGLVPETAVALTAGIDVRGRELHWVIVAWQPAHVAQIISYGIEPVHSPHGRVDAEENIRHTQDAIYAALDQLRAAWRDGWPHQSPSLPAGRDGVGASAPARHINLCLIDAAWMPEPIYQLIRSDAKGAFQAANGMGTNHQRNYTQPAASAQAKRVGHHYWLGYLADRKAWCTNYDADYWKHYLHDALMTPLGQPNSISIFGTNPIVHRFFAEQLVAEVFVREYMPGKGWKERWETRSRHNHFLDATVMALVAAACTGLFVAAPPPAARVARPRPERNPDRPGKRFHGIGSWR